MLFFTNRLIPEGRAGCAYFFVALVRPEYRDDTGLIAHELVHVRQFWHLPFIHGILYRFWPSYRYRCELEAYREQLRHSPHAALIFARYLAETYDLPITIAQALKDLNGTPD